MRPRFLPSFQPPVCHGTSARSSISRGQQRSAATKLVQDVGAETGVVAQPLADVVAAPVVIPRISQHGGPLQRQVVSRNQERAVLEQLAR